MMSGELSGPNLDTLFLHGDASRMTKDVISIGMIGLPETDADAIVEALKLQSRMRLAGIYTMEFSQADAFARRHRIEPFGSLRRFSRTETIHGEVWNTTPQLAKWGLGNNPRPALIRKQFLNQCSIQDLLKFSNLAAAAHALVVPELLHRWTPATLRMRELIATRLGPIHTLEVRVPVPFTETTPDWSHPDVLIALDMVRMLLSLKKVSVNCLSGEKVRFEFERHESEPCECSIEFEKKSPNSTPHQQLVPQLYAQCHWGDIEILTDHELRWIADADWTRETLTGERSAEQVLIDIFGRRIAGGIVPVPDLSDLFRCYRLTQAIQLSLETSQKIVVDDASLPVHHGKFCF